MLVHAVHGALFVSVVCKSYELLLYGLRKVRVRDHTTLRVFGSKLGIEVSITAVRSVFNLGENQS